MQDSSGLIWISTSNGMNVYDGYNIITFDDEPYKKILGKSIGPSFIDSKNNLWFGSKGLHCFNIRSKNIQHFLHEESNPNSLILNEITKIKEDRLGNIWIGTKGGLSKLNPTSGTFINYYDKNNKDKSDAYYNNRIFDFVFDSNGIIWISSLRGLKKLNLNSNKFESDSLPYGLSRIRIKAINIDNRNNLWLNANDSVLLKFNISSKLLKTYINSDSEGNISSKIINQIYIDRLGYIWIATPKGLNLLDNEHDKFVIFKNDYFNFESISDNFITSVYEDKNGLIWIGTASSGVDRMCLKSSKFEHISYNPYIDGGIRGKNVKRILADQNKLWLVTSEGVELFNTISNKTIPNKILHLTNKLNIESIEKDDKENLWIGCKEGLYQYDIKTDHFSKVTTYNIDNPTQTIFDIKYMSDGTLWLGTSIGLVIYNPKTKILRERFHDSALSKLPFLFALKFATYETNNTIINYSNGGVIHCDNKAKMIGNYNEFPSKSLLFQDFNDIKIDLHKNICLASNEGLLLVNKTGMKQYNAESGLPSNRIQSITIDSTGKIWTSSDKGISVLNLRENKFINFNMADGLQSLLFHKQSSAISNKGTLYFGGVNGLNIYNPQSVINKDYFASIRLTSFSCQGKEIFKQSLSDTIEEFKLGNNQNNISFEFSSIYYENPLQIRYAYILEGYDNDWNYIGNRRYGSYTNLPAGSYLLKIKSSLQDGMWSPQIRTIPIVVSSPFWKTNWFVFGLILFIILIIYLVYNFRVKRIIREEERKTEVNKQLSEVKLLALKAQMTPHFIFNSISAIQHFIIDSQNKNALMYLSKFSKLLRIILNNANENKNTIQKEIEFLNLYLELQSIRFEKKIKYQINIEDNYDLENFEIPILLLQPFVENAIEHGVLNKEGEGLILIRFIKSNNQIICEVEDNGIGREKAIKIKTEKKNAYNSLGIKISEDRVKTIAQLQQSDADIKIIDLYNEEGNATGTLVKITLSIKNYETNN